MLRASCAIGRLSHRSDSQMVSVCMVMLTQMLIGDLTARSVLMCDARSASSVLVLGDFTLSP